MTALTLVTLLNFVSADFCANRANGTDMLKSTLLAYSKANDKFGGANVRRVITNTPALEVAAIASVTARCPHLL